MLVHLMPEFFRVLNQIDSAQLLAYPLNATFSHRGIEMLICL